MTRILAGAVLAPLLLALIPSAEGAGCATRRAAFVGYNNAVVVDPVVVAPVVSTFLQVPVPAYPLYGIGYGSEAEVANLRLDVANLRLELAQARLAQTAVPPAPIGVAPSPMPPVPPPAAPTVAKPQAQGFRASAFQDQRVIALLRTSCAECHAAGVAAGKGKNLTLVSADGSQLADVDAVTALQCFRRVVNGTMPPAGARSPQVKDGDAPVMDAYVEGISKARRGR